MCSRFSFCVCLAALCVAIAFAPPAACAASAGTDPSLIHAYEQFGSREGLVVLMDDFMVELTGDPRTRAFFTDADQQDIKRELVDQFCAMLGGPCAYAGKSAKLAIDRAAFSALLEDLRKVMDKHHIPARAQAKLLEKLAPMQRAMAAR